MGYFGAMAAADLAMVDDHHTVAYHPRGQGDALGDPVIVSRAVREYPRMADRIQAGIVLDRTECYWHIPASLLPDVTPRGGDLIVEEEDRWVVDVVETRDEGQRYRLGCIREV